MVHDIYHISGTYSYEGENIKILQTGFFEHDRDTGEIVRGFIDDTHWRYSEIHGLYLPNAKLEFDKQYGDGDHVKYRMRLDDDCSWRGSWESLRHKGSAILSVDPFRMNVLPGEYSFDKANGERIRPQPFR